MSQLLMTSSEQTEALRHGLPFDELLPVWERWENSTDPKPIVLASSVLAHLPGADDVKSLCHLLR